MVTILASTVLGTLGGFARAMLGLSEAMDKKHKVSWLRFVITLLLAVTIGGVIGWTIPNQHPLLIFLAGAGGTYLVEHGYKFIKLKAVKIG